MTPLNAESAELADLRSLRSCDLCVPARRMLAADAADPAAEWTLRLEPVASPAGDASAQPQLTASERRRDPQLARKRRLADGVEVLAADGDRLVRTAARRRVGDDFFANYADVPSVMRLADRTLVAHWLQMSSTIRRPSLRRPAHAVDRRRAHVVAAVFTASRRHEARSTASRRSSTCAARGSASVWLDGRAMKPADDARRRRHRRHGAARRASSTAAGSSCPRTPSTCASASAARPPPRSTTDGAIVAYRGRSAGRDSRHLRGAARRRQWTMPAPVHDDGWKIDGCPVNGPAMSAERTHASRSPGSRRQKDDGHAFVAFSQDAGRTFGAPVRVDDAGSLGRVDVEQLLDGSAVVGWIELAGGQRGVQGAAGRADRHNDRRRSPSPTWATDRNSGYPRMARRGNELVFAWTGSDDSLRVETAVARLP